MCLVCRKWPSLDENGKKYGTVKEQMPGLLAEDQVPHEEVHEHGRGWGVVWSFQRQECLYFMLTSKVTGGRA